VGALLAFMMTQSGLTARGPVERVRRFTRPLEFDFVGWTVDAVGLKLAASGLGATAYLPAADRHALVLDFTRGIERKQQLAAQIAELYGDPNVADAESAARGARADLAALEMDLARKQPAVEAILQEQTAVILREIGLAAGGAAVPPVAFHMSDLPLAVVVSPRSVIRQDANLQIDPDLPLEAQVRLETSIETECDVSALVVGLGGIGTYPTMVAESGALPWVLEVVAHEWTHNYLTLRPLGLMYDVSPELRTMNETAASLMGKEVGRRVLERYYPELLPAVTAAPVISAEGARAHAPLPPPPPAFDFRMEMRETRVTVDRLLEQGQIERAEAYMEERRQVFWANGYRGLRRLNQAYFAFHGAYADEPGGAAGEDPVGAAVRALWAASPDPAAFLRRMAWLTSYDSLQAALRAAP
jgi:hypothetical protein